MAPILNKKQLIEKLTELGIEHDPSATNKVLASLIPTNTDSSTGHEDVEESVEDLDEGDSVTISFQDPFKGPSERTFSRMDHGDGFKKLANLFKEKFDGKVV